MNKKTEKKIVSSINRSNSAAYKTHKVASNILLTKDEKIYEKVIKLCDNEAQVIDYALKNETSIEQAANRLVAKMYFATTNLATYRIVRHSKSDTISRKVKRAIIIKRKIEEATLQLATE